jgi:ML-like domain
LPGMNRFWVYAAVISWGVVSGVRAVDVLSTTGFATCGNGTQDISVSEFDMSFDRTTNELNFAVAGDSVISQNVIGITPLPSRMRLMNVAKVSVSALGQVRYTNTFNPCDHNITQLCPIPAGSFHAEGNITVPDQYASQIPSIAFTIPDVLFFSYPYLTV